MDDMQVVCGEKRHDATSWAVPPCDRLRAGAFVVREEGCAIPRRVVVRRNRNINIRVCQQRALCDRRASWDILQTVDRAQQCVDGRGGGHRAGGLGYLFRFVGCRQQADTKRVC